MSAWETSSYISGGMSTWESENDEPMADMLQDMFHALDRLERRNNGKRSAGRSAISV